jgi:hypothetical protein
MAAQCAGSYTDKYARPPTPREKHEMEEETVGLPVEEFLARVQKGIEREPHCSDVGPREERPPISSGALHFYDRDDDGEPSDDDGHCRGGRCHD